MSAALETERLWWYLARSGGLVALLLTVLTVIWGLLLATRLFDRTPKPVWLLSLHRYIGWLAITFTAVHVGALVVDDFVPFGWSEVLIPFSSQWRPIAVGFGVLAMYLLVTVQLTSVFMRRIPRRWWKRVHRAGYVVMWAGLVHGSLAGADAHRRLYILPTATLTLIVIFLTLFRILTARPPHRIARSTTTSAPS